MVESDLGFVEIETSLVSDVIVHKNFRNNVRFYCVYKMGLTLSPSVIAECEWGVNSLKLPNLGLNVPNDTTLYFWYHFVFFVT
jgi:hypothetical protein